MLTYEKLMKILSNKASVKGSSSERILSLIKDSLGIKSPHPMIYWGK